jgi:hypothetical protein
MSSRKCASGPHPVEADLAGQDCVVGLDDLLVFAAEWLMPAQP